MESQGLQNHTVEIHDNRIIVKRMVKNIEEAEKLAEQSNKYCEIHEMNSEDPICIIWKGSEAIDYLSQYMDGHQFQHYLQPIIPVNLSFRFTLNDHRAVPPSKAHQSDSGFDLTLIDIKKQNNKITFYNTYVAVEPPHGYYFDLVPRSSISKTGYMLANNVGIIDQSYRGNVIVALVKVDDSCPDLQLPCKMVQLILRPWYFVKAINVNQELSTTQRGEGGFGSTNSVEST